MHLKRLIKLWENSVLYKDLSYSSRDNEDQKYQKNADSEEI